MHETICKRFFAGHGTVVDCCLLLHRRKIENGGHTFLLNKRNSVVDMVYR